MNVVHLPLMSFCSPFISTGQQINCLWLSDTCFLIPYETSSAAAALQNDFKKRYKRAAKGLAAAVAKNGCFALQSGKPFDSDKQRCCSGAENSRITICAAKWLQSGFEF